MKCSSSASSRMTTEIAVPNAVVGLIGMIVGSPRARRVASRCAISGQTKPEKALLQTLRMMSLQQSSLVVTKTAKQEAI